MFKSLKVEIPDNVIDRALRIGKPKQSKKWGTNHSMIVKFPTWRHRTAVYRARKTNTNVGLRLDLTQKRMDILNTVRDLAEDNAGVDFVFADVNCSLCFRLTNGRFVYFQTVEEAKRILKKHADDDDVYEDGEDDDEDGDDDGSVDVNNDDIQG